MEISGHTKVVFTPAKELAEAVNAPFEAFSAIEIREGADIEQLFSNEEIESQNFNEEPISEQFLIKRVLAQYGIAKYGVRLEGKIVSLIPACNFKVTRYMGAKYYYRTDKACAFDKYRVEGANPVRTSEADYTPFDVISCVKAILLENVSLYRDELVNAVCTQFKPPRITEKFISFINACIDKGVSSGMFIRSVSDRISLG